MKTVRTGQKTMRMTSLFDYQEIETSQGSRVSVDRWSLAERKLAVQTLEEIARGVDVTNRETVLCAVLCMLSEEQFQVIAQFALDQFRQAIQETGGLPW